jgi:hypothetical protein
VYSPGAGIIPSTVKTKPIRDRGEQITGPVLLNGAGQPLTPAENPVYRTFVVYRSLPFAVFDLTRGY